MKKELYDKLKLEIIKELCGTKHFTLPKELSDDNRIISIDIGDVGNTIGIAVGEFIVENGWDKDDFISGVKHGISLKDGTH